MMALPHKAELELIQLMFLYLYPLAQEAVLIIAQSWALGYSKLFYGYPRAFSCNKMVYQGFSKEVQFDMGSG